MKRIFHFSIIAVIVVIGMVVGTTSSSVAAWKYCFKIDDEFRCIDIPVLMAPKIPPGGCPQCLPGFEGVTRL